MKNLLTLLLKPILTAFLPSHCHVEYFDWKLLLWIAMPNRTFSTKNLPISTDRNQVGNLFGVRFNRCEILVFANKFKQSKASWIWTINCNLLFLQMNLQFADKRPYNLQHCCCCSFMLNIYIYWMRVLITTVFMRFKWDMPQFLSEVRGFSGFQSNCSYW